MWQHSPNPDQAARLIELDLHRRYPGGTMEMIYHTKGSSKEQYWTGGLPALLKKMRGDCENCTGAFIHYNPEHTYGMVCTAVCTCETPCGACAQRKHRPQVMVILTHNGQKDILIGQRGSPQRSQLLSAEETCAK